jgi:tetratricopeptide (TPR) repeat protein
MTAFPPLLIATLSGLVVALVLAHRRVNLGGRATFAFAISAAIYGWVRSRSIRALAESHLGSVPYHLENPLASLGGVPLQELVGWISAIGLAGYFADRLLRSSCGSASAWSTALAAGLGMAAVCLAVETAAVTAGWWSWNLGHATRGALRFPPIALLDWGFVAIDFLLPFELWRRRAPLGQRIVGLLCFPVHLLGHAWTMPVSRVVPLSGFDFVHLGLVAGVAAAAARFRDTGPWPESAVERWRWAPLAAAALLLGTTSVQLLLLREGGLLWTGVPLALAAVGAFAQQVAAPSPRLRGRSVRFASGLFCLLLVGGLLLRLPAAMRDRDFERALEAGVTALAGGDVERARLSLGEAHRLRPSHADAAWLLGWSEMRSGRTAEARAHLEAAVDRRLASVEAVRFLALLEIQEGRAEEALALLARRRARHAETADLAYLAWVAAGGGTRDLPAPSQLLASASEAELRELFALARTLGDRPTQEACRILDGGRSRSAAPPRP